MMEKNAKIYVAGHRGMVGSAIVRELQRQGYTNIITRTHKELDLTRQDAVEEFFAQEKPEYVFLAAAKVGGKLIGVDVDQSANIDTYGEGMCVTSAMKGLAETVKHMKGLAPTVERILSEIAAGNFANYGGKIETLGLVSGDDPTANYVQLPMETTQWGDGFTQDDYKALVKAMYDGDVTVSNDISAMPATTITVNFAGNIK